MSQTKLNHSPGEWEENILPTEANLCRRKVRDSPTYEACGVEAESTGYVFSGCEKACEIGSFQVFPLTHMGLFFKSFVDFLWHLKSSYGILSLGNKWGMSCWN